MSSAVEMESVLPIIRSVTDMTTVETPQTKATVVRTLFAWIMFDRL